MTGSMILGYIMIFVARICDMSLDTVRVICIVKGRRVIGAFLGFAQTMIWVTVIRAIFTNECDIGDMIAYAAGFAAGNYIGSIIEEAIAMGMVSVEVILPKGAENAISIIREAGFGVSVVDCMGKEGPKTLLIIQTPRKQIKKLKAVINSIDPTAFITVLEARTTVNGYFQTYNK